MQTHRKSATRALTRHVPHQCILDPSGPTVDQRVEPLFQGAGPTLGQ